MCWTCRRPKSSPESCLLDLKQERPGVVTGAFFISTVVSGVTRHQKPSATNPFSWACHHRPAAWCRERRPSATRPARTACPGACLVSLGRGVDLVGHGAEAVRLAGKAGLVMLHAFALRLFGPVASAAAAAAAAPAAARAFAILAQLLLQSSLGVDFCSTVAARGLPASVRPSAICGGLRHGVDAGLRLGFAARGRVRRVRGHGHGRPGGGGGAPSRVSRAPSGRSARFALAGLFAVGGRLLGLLDLGFFLVRLLPHIRAPARRRAQSPPRCRRRSCGGRSPGSRLLVRSISKVPAARPSLGSKADLHAVLGLDAGQFAALLVEDIERHFARRSCTVTAAARFFSPSSSRPRSTRRAVDSMERTRPAPRAMRAGDGRAGDHAGAQALARHFHQAELARSCRSAPGRGRS